MREQSEEVDGIETCTHFDTIHLYLGRGINAG